MNSKTLAACKTKENELPKYPVRQAMDKLMSLIQAVLSQQIKTPDQHYSTLLL